MQGSEWSLEGELARAAELRQEHKYGSAKQPLSRELARQRGKRGWRKWPLRHRYVADMSVVNRTTELLNAQARLMLGNILGCQDQWWRGCKRSPKIISHHQWCTDRGQNPQSGNIFPNPDD